MHEELGKPLRAAQIIVGALVLGVVAFLVVALVLGPLDREAVEEREPLISIVASVMAVSLAAASFVVPGAFDASGRKRIANGSYAPSGQGVYAQLAERLGDEGRLFLVFQGRTIVTAAMLEGAALFGCVAYLLEGRLFTIWISAAVGLLMVFSMPTRSGLEDWLERQQRRLREER